MRLLTNAIFSAIVGSIGAVSLSTLHDVQRRIAIIQLKSISHYLKLKTLSGEEIPLFDDKNFKKFLMENMDGAAGVNHLDPWGQPYSLTTKNSKAIVVSAGPDKKLQTDDDIYSESIFKTHYRAF